MKNKFFRKAIVTLLTVASVVGTVGGTQVQAATKEIKKHGMKQGVEYLAYCTSDDMKWFYSEGRGCDVVFTNKNSYPVNIKGQLLFYSKNGKKVDSLELNLYLNPNERTTEGYPLRKKISNFKVSYKVKKISKKECNNNRSNPRTGEEHYKPEYSYNIYDGFDEDNLDSKLRDKFYSDDKVFYVDSYYMDDTTMEIPIHFVKTKKYGRLAMGNHEGFDIWVRFFDKGGYLLGQYCYDRCGITVHKGDVITAKLDFVDAYHNFTPDDIGSFDIWLYSY